MDDLKGLSINDKLQYVQENLVAPKDAYNAFGKYAYRSAESILAAVKPLLAATGTVIKLSDSMELIGERYYLKAVAVFKDNTGEEVAFALAREDDKLAGMASAQVTGSTSSYARKYALNGLLLIDDNKDPDTKDPVNKPAKQKANTLPPVQKPTPPTPTAKTPPPPPTPKKEAPVLTKPEEPKVEEETPDAESAARRAKALAAYDGLDASKVLAHLISKEKITKYIKIADFVNGEDIDTVVLPIYKKIVKTCAKTPEEAKK